MSAVVKYGIGAVVAAAMVFAGNEAIKKDRAEAETRFSISEMERPLMVTCEKALDSSRLEYKSGVETIIGCGCITRQIANKTKPDDLGAADSFLRATVDMAAANESNDTEALNRTIERLAEIQASHALSDNQATRILDAVMEGMSHCSNPDVYFTESERTEIAADAQQKYEKTKLALDEAVKAGHMTRKEADEHLEKMRGSL